MDTIYDTLAKLNKVANAPEIVKEDSNALMKKGLEDLMKKTRFNKDADYKPFGKGDKDYETGLPKDAKKDKMFDDMAAADAAKMNKQKNYTPFSDKQSPDGLPEKKKDTKMFEKESDVERDDRAEKAGREVAHDAKYDGRRHAGKDGKDVTKDIEYDEKHDKDGMHEADINEISNKTIDSYMDKVGQEDGHEQDMETASSKRGKGVDLATAKQLGTAKVKATENAGTLKDAARQGVMARLAELAGIPAQEIEEALGTPQDVAAKIMAENPLDEDMHTTFPKVFNDEGVLVANDADSALELIADEISNKDMNAIRAGNHEALIDALDGFGYKLKYDEGNEFSGARDKAIKAGKNDFTVDGKTYPVKGDKNESLEESDIDQIAEVGKVYSKINKMKMDLVDKGMEPEDAQDKACEKYNVDPSMYDKYVEMKRDSREGTKKNESLEESPAGDALQMAYDKVYDFVGKYDDAALEYLDDNAPIFQQMFDKYDGELDVMASKLDADTLQQIMDELNDVAFDLESGVLESKTEGKIDEGYHKGMMQDVEEGMSKAEFAKKYPGNKDDYDDIKKEIEEMNEDKVEETTTSGSVATSEGSDKPAFANASIYENNEIVKRASQLNEGMNITVSAGSEQEPSINISAQGEEAAKLAQLLKLAGMGMAQPGYSEVQVEVAEDQEFANGADDTNTMDTEYMTQDIAGGLNGPKKMAYPKVAGGDNPMSVLGESELNEVSEDHLMKLYQEYKAK